MKNHLKKLVAPIVVSILLILYFILYFGLLISIVDGMWKYILGIIPAALTLVTIAVCIERIKEIRSGEEDDLSKY